MNDPHKPDQTTNDLVAAEISGQTQRGAFGYFLLGVIFLLVFAFFWNSPIPFLAGVVILMGGVGTFVTAKMSNTDNNGMGSMPTRLSLFISGVVIVVFYFTMFTDSWWILIVAAILILNTGYHMLKKIDA